MTEDWQNGGFGLYIHWPFCAAKCPYCDFNSHVSAVIDHQKWRDAYLKEIDRTAALTQGRVLRSVFFGGGTPSLMDPDVVADILARVHQSWPMANDIEITLEANPTSVEAGRFKAFADAGVNRVSMGIQALNDADLRRLGRMHSASEALAAFDIARNNFDRVSFDLIYARQGQSREDWEKELRNALVLDLDHLSLYQLTIEDGTVFGERYERGLLKGLPSESTSADMFDSTRDICAEMGLPAYEVSNHAKPGSESRHNLIYWRYGDYVGIGPGAHGRLTLAGEKYATVAHRMPAAWLKNVDQSTGDTSKTLLSPDDKASEFLLMGLRLTEGVSLSRFAEISGGPLAEDPILELEELGLVKRVSDRLIVKDQGVIILNAILDKLLNS
ncbi:MAG: radical SAM family heme chaperone HemW [Sulfitobacter sp.]